MEEMNGWLEQFYKETDREEREEIFEKGLKEEGMSPENKFRQQLWDLRYTPGKGEKAPVDHFIRGIVNLSGLVNMKPGFFTNRSMKKTLDEVRADWAFQLAEENGEMGKQLLYEELKHMARVYMHLCQEDKNFSGLILGMGKMDKQKLVDKISVTFFELAYVVPKKMNVQEEFASATRAFTEVFFETYPKKSDRARLQNLIDGKAE